MRALAEAYYAGQAGAEQDFTKAADWYRRLTQTGNPCAQTSLDLTYVQGEGVETDPARAAGWMKQLPQ